MMVMMMTGSLISQHYDDGITFINKGHEATLPSVDDIHNRLVVMGGRRVVAAISSEQVTHFRFIHNDEMFCRMGQCS